MDFYKMNTPTLLPIHTKKLDISSTPEIHLCLLPITTAFKVTAILTSAIIDQFCNFFSFTYIEYINLVHVF